MDFEKNLNLRTIHYVITLAEEGSFTKAANRLYITQPSLSQAIKRFEDENDIQLFYRGQGRLLPTEEGKLFIATGKRVLKLMRDLENDLLDRSRLDKGTLVIGTGYMLGSIFVFKQVSKFREKYPEIDLRLVEAPATELETMVSEGTVDLCVVFQPIRERSLQTIKICSGKMVLIMSKDNPLNEYAFRYEEDPEHWYFDLRKAKNASFVCPTEGNRLDLLSNVIFKKAGFIPYVSLRIRNIVTAIRLVKSSSDLVLLPEIFLGAPLHSREDEEGVRCYYLNKSCDYPWTLVAAHSEFYGRTTTIAQKFVELLREDAFENLETFGHQAAQAGRQ